LTDKQQVTLQKAGSSGNWTALIAVSDKMGHGFSAFEEASSAPTGRLYLPEEDFNFLTTLRRSFRISGTEFTNRTILGDGSSWYFTVEDIEMKEFAKDREDAIMFGIKDDGSVSNRKQSRGIIDWALSEGVNNGYSAATGVAETDIMNQIKELLLQGSSNELYVLCGSQFLHDVQIALRDYSQNGALNYGVFGDNTAGLDFTSYSFMGKTIHFAYYELFDDEKVVPQPGTPSSTVVDFSNFSLWLDWGSTSNGQKLFTLMHKELHGQSRKFIHAYEVGMMNPAGSNGGQVANGDDAFKIHYMAEIGLKVLLPNRLGVLRANAA
jgi:hypothetical protein